MKTAQFVWKGAIPYRESLTLQEQLGARARQARQAFFMGFECRPACVTLGLRGQQETDLTCSPEEYRTQNIEVVTIKRGGQATLHSPGQLVIYPVMDLLRWKLRPRDFLSLLEQITIEVLQKYGITAQKQESFAGLFTDKGKMVFFGIHIKGGVSQHGLAVNVLNNLSLFDLIKSCGVAGRVHDSFQNRGLCPPLEEVFSVWCNTARAVFTARLA